MKNVVQDVTEPRRQERGKQRMESLLRAAEEVFSEVGFERATTNLIAARASVSPGTLYQFYPNKEAMAEALAAQYAVKLQGLQERAFASGMLPLSLNELIDATVDPFLEFHRQAPAFEALFLASSLSPELASRLQVLHNTVAGRMTTLFVYRAPGVSKDDLQWSAEAAVGVFRGLLPLVTSLKGSRRNRAIRELKTILSRYLEPLLGA
jgi:AcrR family transcriptional regulator